MLQGTYPAQLFSHLKEFVIWLFLLLSFGCVGYRVLKGRDSNTLCLK